MNITKVKIRKFLKEPRIRAVVSVTIDGDFAVHDIKVIQGDDRLFVAMPSRKEPDGTYRDVVHPITVEARKALEDAVLTAYNEAIYEEAVNTHVSEEPQC